jgi:hypothetical protein
VKKNTLGLAGMLAVLITIAPSAHATLLGPGQHCFLTCSVISSLPAGTVIKDTGIEAGTPVGTIKYAATLEAIVYQETATGFLDFLYQYSPTAGPDVPNKLEGQDFTGWTTNVSTLTTGGIGGMVAGSPNNPPDFDSRSGGGGAIDFGWLIVATPPQVGQISDILVVQTNATTWQAGQATLQDGGVEAFAAYAPGPEPAGIVLFGTASALTALFFRRRLARKA